jgi:septum site-determining protein MinD
VAPRFQGFERSDPTRLREVVAALAADTDVILLDSPAALGSKSAVLPVVLADRIIVVLQPTVPSLSDGLKIQEYALAYGTGVAGILFNRVADDEDIEGVATKAERYFEGETLASIPESDEVRAARRAGRPLLAHAPASAAARRYREAASALTVADIDSGDVADRFRSAVIPEEQ